MASDIADLLRKVADREECDVSDIEWYSWPQAFGSTAGPRGGVGGNAITTFQVYAFTPPNGRRQRFCAGVWRSWNGEFMQRW